MELVQEASDRPSSERELLLEPAPPGVEPRRAGRRDRHRGRGRVECASGRGASRACASSNVSHELKTPIGAMALLVETWSRLDDVTVRHLFVEWLARGRPARPHRRRSPRPQPHRGPGGPDPDRVPVRVALDEAVDLASGRWRFARGMLVAASVRSRPTWRSTATRAGRERGREPARQRDQYSGAASPSKWRARRRRSCRVRRARSRHRHSRPRDLERILERFYRVDKARSRDTGGTGPGLAIVRHVAQAHGGEVTVQSRRGRRLDLHVVHTACQRQRNGARSRRRHLTEESMADPPLILVVDDSSCIETPSPWRCNARVPRGDGGHGPEAIERFDVARPAPCSST